MIRCDLCDVHDHPRYEDELLIDAARDLHRAMHDLLRAALPWFEPLIYRLNRALTRT